MMLEAFYRFNITGNECFFLSTNSRSVKITDDLIKAITFLPQNRHLFVVSKDEWDTKEGPGKSMKNALRVQRHCKRDI